MAKIRFLLFQPNQSRHKAELDDAEARSHAAYISHQRRQQQRDRHKEEAALAVRSMKGNCDPFDTFAIKITPRVNQILTFVRDVAIPAAYFNSMFTKISTGVSPRRRGLMDDTVFISRCGALREWYSIVDGLNDELTALARLMSYVALLAHTLPEKSWPEREVTQLRGRAIKSLRKALVENNNDPTKVTQRLEYQLHDFFFIACVESDFPAVQVHGAMMRTLFEKGNFTYPLLTKAIYIDADFATRHARYCMLDVDAWCPQVLAPLWTATAGVLPRRPAEDRDIHENVTNAALRDFVARARDVIDLMQNKPFPAQKWTEGSVGDMAFASGVTRELLDCAQLNHLYLDLVGPDETKIACRSSGNRYTQAALVVAVHYLKRRIGNEAMVNGVDYRDANPTLIQQLRFSLSAAFAACTGDELVEYADAHLWALYVGALDEMHLLKTLDSDGDSWFASELNRQALQMDVVRWQEMREIAERFVYADFVEPDGDQWYEQEVRNGRVSLSPSC